MFFFFCKNINLFSTFYIFLTLRSSFRCKIIGGDWWHFSDEGNKSETFNNIRMFSKYFGKERSIDFDPRPFSIHVMVGHSSFSITANVIYKPALVLGAWWHIWRDFRWRVVRLVTEFSTVANLSRSTRFRLVTKTWRTYN